VRAEVGTPEALMRHLADGLLDFVVMYAPEARPGFQIEKLIDESLVLVATRPDYAGPRESDYVFVDWGQDFGAWHSDQFPGFTAPGLHVSLGALGLRHILAHGGAGYFPARIVAADIAAGRLFPVRAAPQFVRPAHVIYPADGQSDVRSAALESLRAATAVDAATLT
jgi:DNA-binding transcriptional LysR family regulator